MSSNNIIGDSGLGRRARNVVNYADAERAADRQLRKYSYFTSTTT